MFLQNIPLWCETVIFTYSFKFGYSLFGHFNQAYFQCSWTPTRNRKTQGTTTCKRRLRRSGVLPGPRTFGAQVGGTAPPPAGGARGTTPLECRTRAALDWRALSAALALPRPASGPGVSPLGWRRPPRCVLGSDPGPRAQVSEPLCSLAGHRCPRRFWEFDPPCRLGCGVRGWTGVRETSAVLSWLTFAWELLRPAPPGSGPGRGLCKGSWQGTAGGRGGSPEVGEAVLKVFWVRECVQTMGLAWIPRSASPPPFLPLCPRKWHRLSSTREALTSPRGARGWGFRPRRTWGSVPRPGPPALRFRERSRPTRPRSSQSTQNYWESWPPGAALIWIL